MRAENRPAHNHLSVGLCRRYSHARNRRGAEETRAFRGVDAGWTLSELPGGVTAVHICGCSVAVAAAGVSHRHQPAWRRARRRGSLRVLLGLYVSSRPRCGAALELGHDMGRDPGDFTVSAPVSAERRRHGQHGLGVSVCLSVCLSVWRRAGALRSHSSCERERDRVGALPAPSTNRRQTGTVRPPPTNQDIETPARDAHNAGTATALERDAPHVSAKAKSRTEGEAKPAAEHTTQREQQQPSHSPRARRRTVVSPRRQVRQRHPSRDQQTWTNAVRSLVRHRQLWPLPLPSSHRRLCLPRDNCGCAGERKGVGKSGGSARTALASTANQAAVTAAEISGGLFLFFFSSVSHRISSTANRRWSDEGRSIAGGRFAADRRRSCAETGCGDGALHRHIRRMQGLVGTNAKRPQLQQQEQEEQQQQQQQQQLRVGAAHTRPAGCGGISWEWRKSARRAYMYGASTVHFQSQGPPAMTQGRHEWLRLCVCVCECKLHLHAADRGKGRPNSCSVCTYGGLAWSFELSARDRKAQERPPNSGGQRLLTAWRALEPAANGRAVWAHCPAQPSRWRTAGRAQRSLLSLYAAVLYSLE